MWGNRVGKIPWRREQLPTPVFWPGEFYELCSSWGQWLLALIPHSHRTFSGSRWALVNIFICSMFFHIYFPCMCVCVCIHTRTFCWFLIVNRPTLSVNNILVLLSGKYILFGSVSSQQIFEVTDVRALSVS